MPPVASTAAQAIFEGLHEDASRSGRTDARLCTGVLAVRVLDNMCVSQSVSQFRRGPPALTTPPSQRTAAPLPSVNTCACWPWCIDPEHFVLDTSARMHVKAAAKAVVRGFGNGIAIGFILRLVPGL
jgi:hypothetical protein